MGGAHSVEGLHLDQQVRPSATVTYQHDVYPQRKFTQLFSLKSPTVGIPISRVPALVYWYS